jgi:CubicO group peptidase (beta-lactamase class C family)
MNLVYRLLHCIFLLLFFFTAIIFQVRAQPGAAKSRYDFSSIDKKIDSWIDSGYYPGASLIVVKNNRVIHEKYFGNYQPQTVTYIASAGKWLAAATIATLVDEGKLSWDDKVEKWLPQFKDIKGKATLRQLFSHTSGYPDYQPEGKHPDDYQTLAESVKHIVDLPADAPPGAAFRYGGLAMQVAGRMAEIASGKNWEDLFQQKIAKPLHMTATHFTPVSAVGGQNPMLGGAARCTLADYANFLSMISNNGVFNHKRILSAKAVKEMQGDQVGNAGLISPTADYVKITRRHSYTAIYGLGEWREEIDRNGKATLLSSPSWAGAYPWVDKINHVYGFFLARVNVENANRCHFSSFYASPVLPMLVRETMIQGKK